MKNYLLISIFASLCSLLLCCQSSPKDQWELVWEDTFGKEGVIDTATWSKIPRGRPDWNNYMSSFDSCYAVKNSNLILYGIRNTTQHQDTAPYLTGGVYTKGKKHLQMAKWKSGQNWALPQEHGLQSGCCPRTPPGRQEERLTSWNVLTPTPLYTKRYTLITLIL